MTSAVLTWCNNITRSSYIITDLGGALDWKARHSYQFPGPPSQVPARLEGLEKATSQEVESDCTGGFLARDVVHNKTRLLGWHTTRLKLRAKLNHVSSESLLKPDDDLCNTTEKCPKWLLIKQKKENYLAPTAPPGVSWTLTGSYKNDENC